MTTRIGDAAQHNRTLDALLTTRERTRALETDVSTGKSARRYAEIPRDTGLLLRTREQLAVNQNYVTQNDRLTNRVQAMDNALGSIVSVAERLRTLLVQRLNDTTGSEIDLDGEASAMTDQVAAQLNLQLEDRYLFAGSRTDTKPVVLPSTMITSADASLYYQGDQLTPSARVDTDVEVSLQARADDPAFASLFQALGLARTAHLANDRAGLEAALTKAGEALDGVVDLRSKVDATASRVADLTEVQRSASLYLDDIRGNIEDTDIADAMTRMSQDKLVLESSYLIISQVSRLSLADYLG